MHSKIIDTLPKFEMILISFAVLIYQELVEISYCHF